MPIDLKMPALSPTMEKGTLAKWLVGVGDMVRPGDLIAEIETDKATMEYEAIDEGRIVALMIAEGTNEVSVGTVIATMAADDEEPIAAVPIPAPIPAKIASVPAAAPVVAPRPEAAKKTAEEGVNATPLARRIAAAQHRSLATVIGSGAHGRIVRADLKIRCEGLWPSRSQ